MHFHEWTSVHEAYGTTGIKHVQPRQPRKGLPTSRQFNHLIDCLVIWKIQLKLLRQLAVSLSVGLPKEVFRS